MQLIETIDMQDQLDSAKLILVNGPPMSGKTTSILTAPEPRVTIIAPGELGFTSVMATPTNQVKRWKEEPGVPTDWLKVLLSVEEVLKNCARGKYGDLKEGTVALDGIHKLYRLIQRALGYENMDEVPEKERGGAWGRCHDRFNAVLDLLVAQPAKYRIATVYDGLEVVDPLAAKKESRIWPDLPGKQAKHIMGRFPLALHSFVFGEPPNRKYMWHLAPNTSISGAGLHLPRAIVAKLPATMEQDFGKLEAAIKASLTSETK